MQGNLKVFIDQGLVEDDRLLSVPTRGDPEAAGLDIRASIHAVLEPGQRKLISTALYVELPKGTYGRLAPRSGLAYKHGIDVLAGVIDSSYRGEIKVLLINLGDEPFCIGPGDRIAQLIVESYVDSYVIEMKHLGDLSNTVRDSGGFGSTGA